MAGDNLPCTGRAQFCDSWRCASPAFLTSVIQLWWFAVVGNFLRYQVHGLTVTGLQIALLRWVALCKKTTSTWKLDSYKMQSIISLKFFKKVNVLVIFKDYPWNTASLKLVRFHREDWGEFPKLIWMENLMHQPIPAVPIPPLRANPRAFMCPRGGDT